jgi:hypothetical protein
VKRPDLVPNTLPFVFDFFREIFLVHTCEFPRFRVGERKTALAPRPETNLKS